MKKKKSTVTIEQPALSATTRLNLEDSARHMMAWLRSPGVVRGSMTFDTSTLTVRVRNRIVKSLQKGVIFGGGQASDLARRLNTQFKLGSINLWNTHITLSLTDLANPQLCQALRELSAVDMTTALLTSKHAIRNSQNYHQDRYSHNLSVLDQTPSKMPIHYYHRHTLFFNSKEHAEQAAAMCNASRPTEQVERVQTVVAALMQGATLTFSFAPDVENGVFQSATNIV